MKESGMLVIPLRDAIQIHGFWSHFGCVGRNANILEVKFSGLLFSLSKSIKKGINNILTTIFLTSI